MSQINSFSLLVRARARFETESCCRLLAIQSSSEQQETENTVLIFET